MIFFISFLLIYAVVVGVMFQVLPFDEDSYSQIEERVFKSVLWPFVLPFFIGSELAKKFLQKKKP